MKPVLAAAALSIAVLSSAGLVSAQGAPVETYCATLSETDRTASDGFELTDAASILRQDRANYHRFKRRDPGDDSDSTFGSAQARERIPAMLDRGRIDDAARRSIESGPADVCVDVHKRSLDVYLAAGTEDASSSEPVSSDGDKYPFVGEWDCEVGTFTFTSTVYNNGSEDLAINEIQEGTDGSYTLFFDDDYLITLSGFTGDTMGWFSHASGDNFSCRRIGG
ncbi:MAG TPA: hypothetical protein VGN97_00170 [Mesorhizobium sp.]|jgi:hypothetical protein|nr:hypothetical protein [Mesorhizobium sp.]